MNDVNKHIKKIVIIGAGIAGLSAGCYAQMNDYSSEIYEMHNIPGGVCTTWKRGDYLFDHCLHWVLGSNKTSSLYPIFLELGVADYVRFYFTERFRRIEGKNKSLIAYTNIDKFEKELLNKFPEENKYIRRMTRQVRFYTRFKPPLDSDFGNFNFMDILKMLPYIPSFIRLTRTTIEKYLMTFKDSELRDLLFQMFPVKSMPALMVVIPLAYFHNKEGGYPMGGSLNFAKAIENRYIKLGGKIKYNQKIKKIITSGNKATAIQTDKGDIVEADIIISACDGRTTLFDMLNGRFLTSQIKKMYENPSLWPPIISISLGVNRDLSGEVELNSFKLEKPLLIGSREVYWLNYIHYCQDPAFAPVGKSVIKIQIESDYNYWKEIYNDPEKYRAEKQKVLSTYLDELEKKLPGIKEQIEEIDIATPVTWERYTGNWQGSYQGWLPTIELFGKYLPKELPGLENFYMTGQWTFPGGGVPMCMSQARRLLKYICQKDKRKFVIR